MKIDELDKFKTKIDFAIELIENAINSNIRFEVAVYDSWFFCKRLCEYLEILEKDWISRAKVNRIINLPTGKINFKKFIENLSDEQFTRIPKPLKLKDENTDKEIEYQFIHEAVLDISDMGLIKCIMIKKDLKDDTGIVLVSNRLDWEADKIIKIYKKRWKIETFYRDSKQNLGLGKYQLRSIKGIERYWTLVFISYTFLQYCTLFGILSSNIEDTTATTGDKVRRFQELYLKSFIDLIISCYKSNGNVKDVYRLILRGKYKRSRKNS